MNTMSDLEIALWILSHGGSVRTISCYDEEGVEGWEWSFNGEDYWDLGDWNDVPTIPNDMISSFKRIYPKGI